MSSPTEIASSEQAETAAAVASFGRHLDEYAQTLTERERRLLGAVIYQAMTPIERARARGETELLAPEEVALLNRLEAPSS